MNYNPDSSSILHIWLIFKKMTKWPFYFLNIKCVSSRALYFWPCKFPYAHSEKEPGNAKAFTCAFMKWPAMAGLLPDYQPQYHLSLFPSRGDQAKTSFSELQLNVLFLRRCRCPRDRRNPFSGLPPKPPSRLSWDIVPHVPPLSPANCASSKAEHSSRVPRVCTQNPARGLRAAC